MAVVNPSSQGGNYHFRCADLGNSTCQWEASGRTEEDVIRQVEQHGREQHNLSEWTDDIKNRVRNLMRRIAA